MPISESAEENEEFEKFLAVLRRGSRAAKGAADSLTTLSFRKQVVEFASQGKGSLGFDGECWDVCNMQLPCRNGMLNLKTGILRDGRPSDFVRSVMPTAYNESAKCPTFERTINEIFLHNTELTEYIQRVLGYAICGHNAEHVLFFLHGVGRNGKSLLLEVLAYVLGDLAGAIQAELLLDCGKLRSSSSASPDILSLQGKRMVWASEMKEGTALDAGRVKMLTGGDTLTGRPLYGKIFINFKPTHALFMLANAKPRVPSDDFAFWQRLQLIPFEAKFLENPNSANPQEFKRDTKLKSKLFAEAEGILAWLVRGAFAWQEKGLSPPAIVKNATESYRADEDVIALFIDECCICSSDSSVQSSKLYTVYDEWCRGGNRRPLNATNFGRKISLLFKKNRTMAGNIYRITHYLIYVEYVEYDLFLPLFLLGKKR